MFKKHYPYRAEVDYYLDENFGKYDSYKKDELYQLTFKVFWEFGRYLEQGFVSIPFQEDVDFFMVNTVYNGNMTREDHFLRILTRRLYDFVEYCQTNKDSIMIGRLTCEKICRHIITYDGTEIFYYDPVLKMTKYEDLFKG